MRLVFVSQEIGRIPSGVMTVLTELCRSWPDEDHITILLNPEHWAATHLSDELHQKNNIDVFQMPSILSTTWLIQCLSPYPRLIRIALRVLCMPLTILQSGLMLIWLVVWLKRNHVEGVLSHTGGWPGGMLNRWVIYASWLAAVPERVLVIHNSPILPHSRLGRALFDLSVWLVGNMASRLVTVSHACCKSLEQDGGFHHKVDVIYNGIPLTVNYEVGSEPSWTKRHLSIGFVGSLYPRKGVQVLLDAFLHVSVAAELVLVGNGDDEYTAALKVTAAQSHWPVHFLGLRDDVSAIYPHLDILVLPSLSHESFGMVLVEAMRAGIPVICSDFGGMPEVVVDGETGVIVPVGDVDALIVAMEKLLNDQDLRHQMGAAGKSRMYKMFGSDTMADAYVSLLHGKNMGQ